MRVERCLDESRQAETQEPEGLGGPKSAGGQNGTNGNWDLRKEMLE